MIASTGRLLIITQLVFVVWSCKHADKLYADGEEWVQKNAFVMRCKMPGDGSWRVEVVACMSPSGQRMEVNSSVVEGNDEWYCLITPDGKITMQQGVNAVAKCGEHNHGAQWREKSFMYECRRGGHQKLVACVAENGEHIPVGGAKEINGYLIRCQEFDNGTVVIHGIRSGNPATETTKFEMQCVDSKGEHHAIGAWWLDNQRFNKSCTESGRIEVLNCVSKEGYKIPINMEVIKDNTKFVCEKTIDGAIRFASGPVDESS